MAGYIYIMTNPCLQNMVKIGYATDVEQRRKQLSTTALPMDYEIYATYETTGKLEDKQLHALIDMLNPDLRINRNREFFNLSPEAAYQLLEAIAIISGSQDKLHRYKKASPLHSNPISGLPDGLYIIDSPKHNAYGKAWIKHGEWTLLAGSRLALKCGAGGSAQAKEFRKQINMDESGYLFEDLPLGQRSHRFVGTLILNKGASWLDVWHDEAGRPIRVYFPDSENDTDDIADGPDIERKSLTLDDYLADKNPTYVALYRQLEEKVYQQLPGSALHVIPAYFCWRVNKKHFAEFHVRKDRLQIYTARPNASCSVGSNVPDSHGWALNYNITITSADHLDEVAAVIIESYNLKKGNQTITEKLCGGEESIAMKPRKAPPLTFAMLGIPVNTILEYVFDKSITVTTVDNKNMVQYNGQAVPISRAAQLIRNTQAEQGGNYFLWKGKRLTEWRKEIEAQAQDK